jgi:hypothetical protein
MNTKRFYDSTDSSFIELSAQETLTENRKIRFPNRAGTIMVSDDNVSVEELYGKRYVAALTQRGVADPTAIIFTPSTSALYGIVWTRVTNDDPAVYRGTLTGAFTLTGSTDLWMRDMTDVTSLEVLDADTIELRMTEDDTLTNRRIEINVL